MRKSLILMLITSLIMGVFLVSCNSEVSGVSSTGDKLVKVSIAGDNKGISAVGVADNGEDYYWYYKATKTNGGIYITGQTDWKAVKDGKGLKGADLGYFSAGSWAFEFRAFATSTSSYDAGYRYYTSVNVELNADKTLELTMSGNGLENALLVFPADLNWGYTPEANSLATVTLSTLSGRKAYMKVYAKAASAETEVLIAKSTKSSITVNGSSATAVFGDFTGINNETDVRLASGEYTLIFKVFVTASSTADSSDNDQQVGEETTQSVTAYLGGVINIAKSDSGYAVSDNESGANIVIDSVYNPVSKTSEATIAPVVPTAPVIEGESGDETATQKSAATTITTSKTAVEAEETKKSSVSIPAEALADSTVTVEKVGNSVTTTTTSSTHALSMKVETENVATTSTQSEFVILDGNAPVVGINLDMTKITTTTIQVNDATPTQNVSEAEVTSFNGKYVTVSTYIEPGLENVQVGYDGSGDQPVFNASNTTPNVETAKADATVSNAGTGYNPTTGLLVFKTNHFSSFFVASKMVAKIGTKEYATLQGAFDAAVDGDVVQLISDVNPLFQVVFDKENASVSLDLAGKNIANTTDIWGDNSWSLISVQKGTLTIKNTTTTVGSMIAKEDDCYALDVRDGATLNVQGGNFNGNITAVYVYEGNLNISGGKFEIQQLASNPTDKYRFTINCLDSSYKNHTAIVSISGGSFYMFDPSNCLAEGPNTNFVSAGNVAVQLEENWWTVGNYAYQVGSNVYKTNQFSAAWTAAKNSDNNFVVLRDMTLNGIQADGDFTVDLNGHTLTILGYQSIASAIRIYNKYYSGGTNCGHLTIKNGTLNLPGTNYSNYGIYSDGGNLTVENVVINSACKTVVYMDGNVMNDQITTTTASLNNVVINSTHSSGTAYNAHAVSNGTLYSPISYLTNCTINSAYNGVMINATNASLTNCNVSANNNGVWIIFSATGGSATGTMTVSGNTVINAGSDYSRIHAQDGNTIVIEAGTYNFDPTSYVNTDQFTVNNADNLWTVEENQMQAIAI